MAGGNYPPQGYGASAPPASGPISVDPGGLAKLKEMKAQAPNAADMSDVQFAIAAHEHVYSDIPMVEYLAKVGLDRGDVLYELRAPGDPYGDYVRSTLAEPATGETKEQVAVRQGGQLDERRAGDGEGVARAALQGATFGFGDEVVAAGAAALDPLVNGDRGKDFGERFNTYLGNEQGLVENFREDNPIAAYGAEIAGALPTAALGGGQLVARGTNALSRTSLGAAVAAGEGGIYGFGSTNGDLEDRAVGAGLGAVTGVAALGVGSALGKVVGGTVNALTGSAGRKAAVSAAPTALEIKAASQAAYDAAEATGAVISPNATPILRQDMRQLMVDEGLVLPDGTMSSGYGLAKRAMKELKAFEGQPMTLKQFQRFEETLQDVAASKKSGESRIGVMMLNQLDDFFENLPQGGFQNGGPQAAKDWLKGKEQWALFKRTKTIERIIDKAQLSKGSFADGLRSGFRQLITDERKSRGFSSDQLAQMRSFVEGGPVQSFLDWAKSGNGFMGAVLGHVAGGPAAAVAVPAAGMAASAMLKGGARNVSNALRANVATNGASAARSPVLGGSMPSNALGWGTVAAERPLAQKPRSYGTVTLRSLMEGGGSTAPSRPAAGVPHP